MSPQRQMRRRRRVPVERVDDEPAVVPSALDLAVDRRDDVGRACDGQAAIRVGEVVLDVDDDEGGFGVVALHG